MLDSQSNETIGQKVNYVVGVGSNFDNIAQSASDITEFIVKKPEPKKIYKIWIYIKTTFIYIFIIIGSVFTLEQYLASNYWALNAKIETQLLAASAELGNNDHIVQANAVRTLARISEFKSYTISGNIDFLGQHLRASIFGHLDEYPYFENSWLVLRDYVTSRKSISSQLVSTQVLREGAKFEHRAKILGSVPTNWNYGSFLFQAQLPNALGNNLDLNGINFGAANLKGVNLSDSNCSKCGLLGSNLIGSKLRSTSFNSAYLSESKIDNADFSFANLSNAIIRKSSLQNVVFLQTNITNTDFNASILDNSKFSQALVVRTNFSDSSLQGVIFEQSNFSFTNLSKAVVSKSSLKNIIFLQTNLTGTDFSASILDGSKFSHSILEKTNFTDSSLRGVIFEQSDISTAKFDGADVEGAVFTNAVGFSEALLKNTINLNLAILAKPETAILPIPLEVSK